MTSQEHAMRVILTITLALVTSAGFASAQISVPGTPERPAETTNPPPLVNPSSQLQLTPTQKTAILDAVRQDGGKATAPTNFVVSVGAPVPPQLELYVLPDRALTTVPDARSVKYTVVQNQIVLVDPTTMRVVDVIPQ
jgi:glucose/arabinose dehydrogenase